MTKVYALKSVRVTYGEQVYDLEQGKEYSNLPDPLVSQLVDRQIVAEHVAEKPDAGKKAQIKIGETTGRAPAGRGEGIDLEEFVKGSQSGGAMWIRTADLEEGDEFEVIGPGEVDAETFDKPYLCIPVFYKGLEKMLRLGVQNVARISRTLGKSSADWVGKRIRVTALESCPDLSKQRGAEVKRAILDGVA